MVHTRDFSPFEFSPLLLPTALDEDTNPSVLRALAIYAQINPEGFDLTTLEGLQDIADELDGTEVFQATEAESPLILGVASFQTPRTESDYLFVEGIAVHKQARGMELGVFIIENIVEMARSHGKSALEGNVRPRMEPYYEKRGWQYVDNASNPQRMRLEIQ